MICPQSLSKFLTLLLILGAGATQAQSSLCREVFLSSLSQYPAEKVAYDWPTAIFLYGAELYAKNVGEGLSEKLDPYYDSLAEKIPTIRDPDKASLSLPASVRKTPSGKKIMDASLKFFSEEPRNSLGIIDHVGSRGFLGSLYPSSVWADSLIMSSLNQFYLATTDKEKKEILKEALVILSSLRSSTPGLFSHAYYPKMGWRFPLEFHWARGNLWVAMFLTEVSANDEKFLPLLEEEIAALKKLYVPGKGLRTLLDDPSSPFESSATALFGYVLWKGKNPELQEEMTSVISGFVKDKRFTGVSGPTTAFPLPLYYRSLIPMGEFPYGTGAFLLWCSEATKEKITSSL